MLEKRKESPVIKNICINITKGKNIIKKENLIFEKGIIMRSKTINIIKFMKFDRITEQGIITLGI
jgi:hypothetical protein